MASLQNQTISTSYGQLLKTVNAGGIDGTLQAIEDGDGTTTALELSSAGVRSTGTLNAAGATTLSSSLAVTGAATLSSSLSVASTSTFTGAATFGTSLTAPTGTATIGTLFASGPATFGTNLTASTGTATIGTLSASTATISTATLPLQLGNITFGSNITASTGTATIGTLAISGLVAGNVTFGSNITSSTGTATIGTLRIGAGSNLIAQSYGTAAFTASTLTQSTTAGAISTGTFSLPNSALGDLVIGTVNSVGSTTSSGNVARPILDFNVEAAGVARWVVYNTAATTTATIPAGTIFATALRYS